MKDLSVLVIDQGTIVDRIDYNIQNVATTVDEGLKQLQKLAERTQKQGGMVMCATVLVIMCCIMLVLLDYQGDHIVTERNNAFDLFFTLTRQVDTRLKNEPAPYQAEESRKPQLAALFYPDVFNYLTSPKFTG